MMKKYIMTLFIVLLFASQLYCDEKISSQSAHDTGIAEMRKAIERNKLEQQGYFLARQGLYEEALVKYKAAQNPALLNHDYEKPEVPIIQLYMRQGKFEQALQIVEENFKKRPQNEEIIRERNELLALIKARDTKSNEPIYGYIAYLKTKYSKYLPPNGYFVGMSDIYINDLIHLYDYMRDYDSGIAFMNEVIKYHTQRKDPAHRSALSLNELAAKPFRIRPTASGLRELPATAKPNHR